MAVENITRVCQRCGSTFKHSVQIVRAEKGARFCSQPCRASHRHDLARKNWIQKVCERCSRPFQVKRSRADAKFCSHTCSGPGKAKRPPAPIRVRVCQRCGGSFTVKYPGDSKVFCSFSCRSRSRPLRPTVDYRSTTDERGRRQKVHRMRAEAALGRPLPKGAEVHHADGSKSEHAPLVICQDVAYHRLLHQRMRVKAAGGNPNTDAMCSHCRRALPFSSFYKHHRTYNGLSYLCQACTKIYQRAHPRKSKRSAA